MLRLTVNDIDLDLDTRSTVTVQGFNPALDTAIGGRVFSFPFRIMATGRNLNVLGHPNRLDAAPSSATFPAVLHIDTAQLRGIVEVSDRTQDTIEIVFKSKERKLAEEMEAAKINTVLESITVPQTYVAKWDLQLNAGSNWFVNINGTSYSVSGTPSSGAIAMAAAINADYPGVAAAFPLDNRVVLTPTASPFEVDAIGGGQNLTVLSYRNFSIARRDNFQHHYNALRTTPVASHAFPVVFNIGFFSRAENPVFSDYLNYGHGVINGLNTPQATQIWEFSYVPFVRVKYVFARLLTVLTEVKAFGGYYDAATFGKLLTYNNLALDEIFLKDFFTDLQQAKWMNSHKQAYNLNDHVPDMTALEYMNAILGFLNLYAYLDGTTLIFRQKIAQLQQSAIDWTDKITAAYEFQSGARGGATLIYKADSTDVSYQEPAALGDYVTGYTGETDIETAYRPLQERELTDQGDVWRVPYLQAKGSSDAAGLSRNPYGNRIFYDFGAQEDSGEATYWQGARTRSNMSGTPQADFDMQWDGTNGMYNTLWKRWAEMLADAPTVKLSARLDGHDIEDLLKWDNPVRYIRTPAGAVKFLVKSFEFRRSAGGEKVETTVEGLIL